MRSCMENAGGNGYKLCWKIIYLDTENTSFFCSKHNTLRDLVEPPLLEVFKMQLNKGAR